MKEKKKVKAREFVMDLRDGMDDDALMTKYDINLDQFHKLLKMTLDSGMLNVDELHSRISHSKTAITRAFVQMQEAVEDLSTVTALSDKNDE